MARERGTIAQQRGLVAMSTTTKKELIDQIAEETGQSRSAVKKTVQSFLHQVIRELSKGNRLEFRDFGVFEMRHRSERTAQNPRTMQPITVPSTKTVRFKAGRLMKKALDGDIDPRSLTPVDGTKIESPEKSEAGRESAVKPAPTQPTKQNGKYEVFASGLKQRG